MWRLRYEKIVFLSLSYTILYPLRDFTSYMRERHEVSDKIWFYIWLTTFFLRISFWHLHLMCTKQEIKSHRNEKTITWLLICHLKRIGKTTSCIFFKMIEKEICRVSMRFCKPISNLLGTLTFLSNSNNSWSVHQKVKHLIGLRVYDTSEEWRPVYLSLTMNSKFWKNENAFPKISSNFTHIYLVCILVCEPFGWPFIYSRSKDNHTILKFL